MAAETETFVGASGELHDGTGFDLAWTKPGTDPAGAKLDAWDDGTVEGLGGSADSGSGDTYYLAPTAQGTDAMAYGRIRDLAKAIQTPLCAKLQDDNNYAAVDVAGTGSIGTRIEVTEAGVVDDGDVRWQGANDQWIKVEVDASGNIEGFTGGTGASPSWTSEGSHATTAFGSETNQGLVCPSNTTTTFGSANAKYYEITFDSIGGGGTTGTAAQTLPAVTQSATGIMTFTATADQTLASLTQSASGSTISGNTGTIAQTLPSITQSADGSLQFSGTTSQMLAAITQSASGGLTFTGTAAQTLASVVQSASGEVGRVATISQTLPVITQDGTGELSFTSTSSQILPAITQSARESEQEEVVGPPGSMFTSKGIRVSFKKSRFRK